MLRKALRDMNSSGLPSFKKIKDNTLDRCLIIYGIYRLVKGEEKNWFQPSLPQTTILEVFFSVDFSLFHICSISGILIDLHCLHDIEMAGKFSRRCINKSIDRIIFCPFHAPMVYNIS